MAALAVEQPVGMKLAEMKADRFIGKPKQQMAESSAAAKVIYTFTLGRKSKRI